MAGQGVARRRIAAPPRRRSRRPGAASRADVCTVTEAGRSTLPAALLSRYACTRPAADGESSDAADEQRWAVARRSRCASPHAARTTPPPAAAAQRRGRSFLLALVLRPGFETSGAGGMGAFKARSQQLRPHSPTASTRRIYYNSGSTISTWQLPVRPRGAGQRRVSLLACFGRVKRVYVYVEMAREHTCERRQARKQLGPFDCRRLAGGFGAARPLRSIADTAAERPQHTPPTPPGGFGAADRALAALGRACRRAPPRAAPGLQVQRAAPSCTGQSRRVGWERRGARGFLARARAGASLRSALTHASCVRRFAPRPQLPHLPAYRPGA